MAYITFERLTEIQQNVDKSIKRFEELVESKQDDDAIASAQTIVKSIKQLLPLILQVDPDKNHAKADIEVLESLEKDIQLLVELISKGDETNLVLTTRFESTQPKSILDS